jgi:hypothetical protein
MFTSAAIRFMREPDHLMHARTRRYLRMLIFIVPSFDSALTCLALRAWTFKPKHMATQVNLGGIVTLSPSDRVKEQAQ